ncbi:response regulator with -like aaa-type and dna-binding domains : Response regulator with CheY-like receiver, AAA-type ATPase, and DNA-binding domains OS=Singulisphaera acidiphila (strain ATCC BAA-1392 / DSM 18658 / VKM B-2454 / MOB10) GN=Sinac_0782 PE=4 SV=1: Response_reg: Sigma54_activat: HTH_8 [Gemmata massiliana]|uniref:DNA-binding transcriptional regulator NtrC n=1 Tax=Gemmata massiliana TaxID=1210884 RepID=A0A6P2D2C8_9BACT|nr:sigma-54 dependent transcriptional regulator [Gemmata massiliana]VTR95289.1 response regulator with -like aaa-type and dna-binding domains : Response regulator with CheY-like receiver, AAA-type ATPase, and DNA-binding domains OS=Singulisphaera acidiphila (strain ATCC BAA-1392 / DSM 18658 / VKM B-2454 / MOB10) GN=Sinac_0782 PE=4 SV=1: Response_reg: Sigma54_activat: HTH_8 [Gemmata massiliana]
MPKLLIIDDEPGILYSLKAALESDDTVVVTAPTAKLGLAAATREKPDAVILDVRLPDMSGLDAFVHIRESDPHLPVVIITAHGNTDTAIEAMKRGAFEYLLKPVDLHQLDEVIGKAFELRRIQSTPTLIGGEAPQDTNTDQIVGRCPAMLEVYKLIGRIAPQDVTVLILGESGTGKELVARALYQHSARADGPFVAINCAAIPDALLESELFGHERGSFTGADRKRIGKFEQAHGGTIFMDEIGDMSPATQAKVLRLLQDQRFERVGGNETIETNVRVVAATNQNLAALVAAGKFREDLFYRLNSFTIPLPPLRERTGDVGLLVNYFITATNRKLGKHVRGVDPEALAALEAHHWPGNVRELENTVRFAVVQAVGEVITLDALPASIRGGPCRPSSTLDLQALIADFLRVGTPDIYRQVTQSVDRVLLTAVLDHVHGNQKQASDLLGISRTTLRAKLQSLNLGVEKQLRSSDPGVVSMELPIQE